MAEIWTGNRWHSPAFGDWNRPGRHRLIKGVKNLRGVVCASTVLFTLVFPGRGGADTRLADAAMKRDAAAVRALIAQKLDVNEPGTDGSPALHWAVRVDDAAMAKMLLGAGA